MTASIRSSWISRSGSSYTAAPHSAATCSARLPIEVIRRGHVRRADVAVEVLGMTHPHAAGADEPYG